MGIGGENPAGNLPAGEALVHGALFDVTVRLFLRHAQALDQGPFGLVDQADFRILSSTVACLASIRRIRSRTAHSTRRDWVIICVEVGLARVSTPNSVTLA